MPCCLKPQVDSSMLRWPSCSSHTWHLPIFLHPSSLPCRYPSDDINKFLWMVRIGGGVFPDIKESNYLAADGEPGTLNLRPIGWQPTALPLSL